MTRAVRFSREAASEMAQAIRWYENEQRGLGLRFLSALRDACDRIEDWPRAAPRIHNLPDDLDVRRFPTPGFPYHIVYSVTARHIVILAVAHDARKPLYWYKNG